MPSERIQRRIDAFLDQAEAASDASAWDEVAEKARAVLGIDPENEDALAFIAMVQSAVGGGSTSTPATEALTEPASTTPDTFAGGRYVVRRFLGEGGKKRV